MATSTVDPGIVDPLVHSAKVRLGKLVQEVGFRFQIAGFGIQVSGFRVQGPGFGDGSTRAQCRGASCESAGHQLVFRDTGELI